jgi:hypothetical protein
VTIQNIGDVEFGAELEPFDPDTSLTAVSRFAAAVGWGEGGGRFSDHARARAQGLPGALVPGIMAMGFLTTMIHRWAPTARVQHVDLVFRAPLLADDPCHVGAVVTDMDEAKGLVELDLSVKNASGESRIFGTARVKVPTG